MFRGITVLVLLFAGAQVAPPSDEAVTVLLPAPTGPHPVGVTTLHLVEEGRLDPWPDAVGRNRELMATVFYPARDVRDHPVAPQLSPGAAVSFGRIDAAVHSLPTQGVDWAATMTHSHTDAPARAVRRPVLLYSPGLVDPRTIGTTLAEELASRGYVVVTIDHPGETSEVEFPDGAVREFHLPGDPSTDDTIYRTAIDTRVADTRFVLDELTALAANGRDLPENLHRALDLRRVGMYGHGLGGTIAAQAMYDDRRIDAAINLEGFLDHHEGELLPVAGNGVDRPLLLLGTDGFRDARYERSWSAMLAQHGCTSWRQLDGATHWVFTDYAAMAPQLQAAGLLSEENRVRLVGAMDPEDSVPAVRGHVTSFFSTHLRRRGGW